MGILKRTVFEFNITQCTYNTSEQSNGQPQLLAVEILKQKKLTTNASIVLDYDRKDTSESLSIFVNGVATWITHLVYNTVTQSGVESEIKNLNMVVDHSTRDCQQLSTSSCHILLIINQTTLLFYTFCNVFIFNNFTYSRSSSTIFCDETVIKLRIRIAILILILVNDCAASRDTTSRIVIRLIIVIDIIDNKARIIFDGTFNILILTEILMAILTVDDLLQVLLKINPVILVTFVFDDSTANIDITKHSTLFTIMFCDKVFNAMCIRIALEISINSCKEPCDSPLRIVTKFIRLNDMIDSPISTGIILHNVVDIGIEMELILIVFIAYWLDGTIQSTIPILWLIDAIVYLTALIFGTANSISPGKAQNKIKKQS